MKFLDCPLFQSRKIKNSLFVLPCAQYTCHRLTVRASRILHVSVHFHTQSSTSLRNCLTRTVTNTIVRSPALSECFQHIKQTEPKQIQSQELSTKPHLNQETNPDIFKNKCALNKHGEQLRARCAKRTNKNRARSSRADSPLACIDEQQQLRAVLLGFYNKSPSRSCEGSWKN